MLHRRTQCSRSAIRGASCSTHHRNFQQGISRCLHQQAQGVPTLPEHHQIKTPSSKSSKLDTLHIPSRAQQHAPRRLLNLPVLKSMSSPRTLLSMARGALADLHKTGSPALHRNYQQSLSGRIRHQAQGVSTFQFQEYTKHSVGVRSGMNNFPALGGRFQPPWASPKASPNHSIGLPRHLRRHLLLPDLKGMSISL
jgi:hypothetical protein